MIFLEIKCLLHQVVFHLNKNKANLGPRALPPYPIILFKKMEFDIKLSIFDLETEAQGHRLKAGQN